jgi:hypothetical protein
MRSNNQRWRFGNEKERVDPERVFPNSVKGSFYSGRDVSGI